MTLARTLAWLDTEPRCPEPVDPPTRRAVKIIATIVTAPADLGGYTAMALIGTRWRSLIDQRTRLPARFPTDDMAHGAAVIAAHVHDAGGHADHWAYR